MKKFVICLLVVFIGVSCEKEVNRVCGCSPIYYSFSLYLKNQQNQDLLDSTVAGSFNKKAIKLQYKKDNQLSNAPMGIFSPSKANPGGPAFHFIYSGMADLNLSMKVNEFFLDYGNGDRDTITFDKYSTESFEPINLKVNNKPLIKETSMSPPEAFYTIVK